MADRWAVELAEALRSKGGSGGGLMFATVKTAKPLVLLNHDQSIKQGLYINPALILLADDETDLIAVEFEGLTSSPFPFLKEFHERFVVRKDDLVLVLQVGDLFYVLEKVKAL